MDQRASTYIRIQHASASLIRYTPTRTQTYHPVSLSFTNQWLTIRFLMNHSFFFFYFRFSTKKKKSVGWNQGEKEQNAFFKELKKRKLLRLDLRGKEREDNFFFSVKGEECEAFFLLNSPRLFSSMDCIISFTYIVLLTTIFVIFVWRHL